jgi:catechol 2,3-dioxygenase-like lactoylglutathione lyase family enzyme
MFTDFQINLFVKDVERCVAFYRAIGFVETYRTPLDGAPDHVEVRQVGLTLGIASVVAARDIHGLDVSSDGNAMEVCLWSDDVDATYAQMIDAGGVPIRAPHGFQDGRLRTSWVEDPEGNLVEIVQRMKP